MGQGTYTTPTGGNGGSGIVIIRYPITEENINVNFTSRKKLTINNNSGAALTDYQVLVTVTYSNKMQANFNDIRFMDASGNMLPYWIESKTDSSTATVWIKCNLPNYGTSPTGDNTIYMYYGNSNLTSGSNGVNTFIQWHDDSTTNYLDSLSVPYINVIYEAKAKPTNANHDLYFGLSTTSTNPWGNAIFIESITSTNYRYLITFNTSMGYDSLEHPSFTNNIDVKLKIILVGTIYHAYVDNDEIGSGNVTQLPSNNMGLYFYRQSGTGEVYYAFVRKYTATEPTVTINAEEQFRKGCIIL